MSKLDVEDKREMYDLGWNMLEVFIEHSSDKLTLEEVRWIKNGFWGKFETLVQSNNNK